MTITIFFTVNIRKQYTKFILEVNTMNIFLCYRSECHSAVRDSLRWRLIFTERRIFNDLKSIVVRIPCVISVDSEVGHERRSNLKWLWWNGVIWYFFYKTIEILVFLKIVIGFFSSFINIMGKKINFIL